MKFVRIGMLCCSALTAMATATAALAEEDAENSRREIVVIAQQQQAGAGTKTDTPIVQVPQPITVVDADTYLSQGAVSVSDTLRYVSGVQANPYGPDSRVDGVTVRGLDALQFRDGMRDIFSYYASIRSDPYNFSRVELVRGPASVLFGAGALGGILNMVSKVPEFERAGEVSLRYGSHNRKEALADITGPLGDTVAVRLVGRVRDSGSQTDHVPDDRVMVAPSITWAPTSDTNLTLLGLYQEDDGGSTSQFLPLYGTLYDNPNGKLPNDLFVGKPGWDRYDGRLLQGTAMFDQRFGDAVKLSLKARYIDSDLTYLTHYPDNYSNPTDPFLDAGKRLMGLYSDGSKARMEIFSTDNNLQFKFDTGANVEHLVLAGVDYSWNRVRKVGGYGYEIFDIYDIDYDALSDYDGGLPQPSSPSDDTRQAQIGFYLQDQIRFADRVSVVLGVRRDKATARSFGGPKQTDTATSFRAGIIGDVTPWLSPFFSYTESFEPIAGTASDGNPFKPKQGRQYEVGVKFHPNDQTLITVTGYHIKESNRPVDDPSTPDPFDQMQAGSLTSKGFEIEASTVLPGQIQLLANYSYNKAQIAGTGHQVDNVPKHNASVWAVKTFTLGEDMSLRLGGGVRHSGANYSYGDFFPAGVRTPAYTLVDALAELNWQKWSVSINANNLLGKDYYSACLARGDCFMGDARNVFGTVTYHF